MKCLLFCLFLSSSLAYADCDIEPLRKAMTSQYNTVLPVTNEKGEIGSARTKNFVVSDFLMKIKNESFLIANFDLAIKWKKGRNQMVKTMVVATVDPSTCTIESYDTGDTLGSSMNK